MFPQFIHTKERTSSKPNNLLIKQCTPNMVDEQQGMIVHSVNEPRLNKGQEENRDANEPHPHQAGSKTVYPSWIVFNRKV